MNGKNPRSNDCFGREGKTQPPFNTDAVILTKSQVFKGHAASESHSSPFGY